MREKGFERRIDVWLDTIRAVIDLEMDDGLKWISTLPGTHVSGRCRLGYTPFQLLPSLLQDFPDDNPTESMQIYETIGESMFNTKALEEDGAMLSLPPSPRC